MKNSIKKLATKEVKNTQVIKGGYNVVTYTYRGYGQSSEFDIDNNM